MFVDSHVDLDTFNILAKKLKGGAATLYTTKRSCGPNDANVKKFNAQYPTLEVKTTDTFHDRFLVLDAVEGCHAGAALKDADKKRFGIRKTQDAHLIGTIMARLGVERRCLLENSSSKVLPRQVRRFSRL